MTRKKEEVPEDETTAAGPPLCPFQQQYELAADMISAATKKFTEAGMSGTDAGSTAFSLYMSFCDKGGKVEE